MLLDVSNNESPILTCTIQIDLLGGDMYQDLTSDDKLKMENYHDSPEDKYDVKRGCREYIERN